jgi:hypothetical protein
MVTETGACTVIDVVEDRCTKPLPRESGVIGVDDQPPRGALCQSVTSGAWCSPELPVQLRDIRTAGVRVGEVHAINTWARRRGGQDNNTGTFGLKSRIPDKQVSI